MIPQKAKELKADYLAIVDLGLRKSDTPALTLGLRGIITLDVELEGSKTDLHSGLHGGIAPNPIHALVQLLAKLREGQGRVTIPHFYDDVREMTMEEASQVSFTFDEKEYFEQTGASPLAVNSNIPFWKELGCAQR